jgi:hypothetical protein
MNRTLAQVVVQVKNDAGYVLDSCDSQSQMVTHRGSLGERMVDCAIVKVYTLMVGEAPQ